MRLKKYLLLLATAILGISNVILAQPKPLYPDSEGMTFLDKDGNAIKQPFTGGLSNAQVSNVDLNNDGVQDIVIFEPIDELVLPHLCLRKGVFKYVPEYAANFPKLSNWALFRDYDRDGKVDIFTFSAKGAGVDIYRNTSTEDKPLTFKKAYTQIRYRDVGIFSNLYVANSDLPSISDLDGDGDLDILAFDVTQTFLLYYKNHQVEKGLPKDSCNFIIEDRCFGKLTTTFADTFNLYQTCGRLGPRAKHGASGITTIDMDGDGDQDLLFGNIFYPNAIVAYNGKAQIPGLTVDSMLRQSNPLVLDGKQIVMPMLPGFFQADADGDGVKDLFVAPQAQFESNGKENLWHFRNNGSDGKPDYKFVSKVGIAGGTLDFGHYSSPAFWDYDGDGDKDIVIATQGNAQAIYKWDRLVLFQNKGTDEEPIYAVVDSNLVDFVAKESQYSRPAVGDLDGDGKEDLIIGTISGKIYHYRNETTNGDSARLRLVADSLPGVVSDDAYPCLVDVDGDSLIDLVLGRRNGTLDLYLNKGSKTEPAYVLEKEKLGGVNVSATYYDYIYDSITGQVIDSTLKNVLFGYATPAVHKDAQGKLHLYIGSLLGNLWLVKDFTSKLDQNWTLDGSFIKSYVHEEAMLASPEKMTLGALLQPTVIERGTEHSIVMGTIRGGLMHLSSERPDYRVGIPSAKDINEGQKELAIALYPNPAHDAIVINTRMQNYIGELWDMTGKRLASFRHNSSNNYRMNLGSLVPGIYFVRIYSSEGVGSATFLKR